MTDVQIKKNDKKQGIVLSNTAISHIKKHLKQHVKSQGIRFSVNKTGCSGLSYVVDYVDMVEQEDKAFVIDEFLTVYVEKKAYPYLQGMSVDYVKEGLNYKFVFDNPNQTGACGCGESFTIDDRFE